jgi:predicted Abi (CAAX) family protease
LFLFPALGEELLFRALLLPTRFDGVGPLAQVPWVALSVGLFVAWHPLMARTRRDPLRTVLADPRFLVQATLLGLACSLAYLVSGSIWPAALIHWLTVVVWLLGHRLA